MAELVSKIYSQALFEVAKEQNKYDVFLEEIMYISSSLKENPELYEILKTPQINIEEKKQILDNLFKNNISQEVVNFAKVILDKRRIKNIFSIAKEFENMVYDYKGIVRAEAITTVPLNEKEIQKLKEKLTNLTGKNVELKNTTDGSLIGGALVKIGNKVIDGTIKKKLKDLEDSLAEIIV